MMATTGRRVVLCTDVPWFTIGGLAHFVATGPHIRTVPPLVPWPRALVLVSGAVELPGAAGLH